MSIVEQFGPAALSWLRQGAKAANSAVDSGGREKLAQTPVSLASVEYELSQLRGSLQGIVSFPGCKAGDTAGIPHTLPAGGIEPRHAVRGRLVTLA